MRMPATSPCYQWEGLLVVDIAGGVIVAAVGSFMKVYATQTQARFQCAIEVFELLLTAPFHGEACRACRFGYERDAQGRFFSEGWKSRCAWRTSCTPFKCATHSNAHPIRLPEGVC